MGAPKNYTSPPIFIAKGSEKVSLIIMEAILNNIEKKTLPIDGKIPCGFLEI
jgi:hypothetical protein